MRGRAVRPYDARMDILAYEQTIRLSAFIGMLVLMTGLELLLPKRKRVASIPRRWATNFALVVINSALLQILFPILAVGVAIWAAHEGYGLFNLLNLSGVVEIIAAIILLDLTIYGQHVAFHKIPLFWRMHRVHHADRDLDTSSGLRFHPLEIIVSMLIKFAIVIALGAPAVAVMIFEVLLNAGSLFNHANLRIPKALDKALRLIIVTPDMHRVHHSIIRSETNSNYGFSLSLWDRIFGTYTDQPAKGHNGMTIGLEDHQSEGPSKVWWSIRFPISR